MKKWLCRYREWFAKNDADPYLSRWLLIALFVILYWWQVDRVNNLYLGSHLQNSIGIFGVLALLLLPRKIWPLPILFAFIASNFIIFDRSFGMVHQDHIFYFQHPLKSITEGLNVYRSGTEYPVAYFPWSSLVFYPLWKVGIEDLRYIFTIMTALAGYLLYLSQSRRAEGLVILVVFLFNGFIHESNLFMFVSNAPYIFFLFIGFWAIRTGKYSIVGASSIAIAAAIKQQGLLIIPFLTVWWLYKLKYKEVVTLLLGVAVLLIPFIIQDPGQFYEHTIKSFTDYYATRHYEYFHHFWRWDDQSIHNIVALFPGGVEWAWSIRSLPVATAVYILVFTLFTRKARSWNDLVKWQAVAGILFFFFTLSINWAIYYLVFLFTIGFTIPEGEKSYRTDD